MKQSTSPFSEEEKDAIRAASMNKKSGDFNFPTFLRLLKEAKREKGLADN